MCLESLSEDVANEYGRRRSGWKVFILYNNGKLCGDNKNKIKDRPEGVWLDSSDYGKAKRIRFVISPSLDDTPDKIGTYEAGWHIFLNELDAKEWASSTLCREGAIIVIKKVKFKEPVAWGYHTYQPVVIAKKMFILKGKGREKR